MARRTRWFQALPLMGAAVALILAAGVALGQAQTGNLFVRVVDESGAPLPGTSLQLSGIGAPLNSVSNVNGEVRFLSLSPGAYKLAAALQGFTKVERSSVVIAVGQNTSLNITMRISGVEEKIVVTGESPLLDTRKTGSSSVISKVELEDIPTARDPWVILQTAPGVQIDRVNVGGSESGQQSVYIGKGDNGFQGTWNVDGVNITDMGALGSSPTYYDFDSFAELQVSTGGADVTTQTPGAQLNMVTKRGTNDVHGSARVLITDKKFQSSNNSEELDNQLILFNQKTITNQVEGIQDYGAELGGPVITDHLWLWGAYGRQQINNVTAGGFADRTTLEGLNFKLNAQIIPENSFTAVYSHNDKIKLGRNVSLTRPPEAAWNQGGPTKLYKLEDSHIFSGDVFATASFSRIIGGFQLVAASQDEAYLDENGVWHRGFYNYYTDRPQTQAQVAPSFFLRTGNIGHEFKVGFGYRSTPIGSQSTWPGGVITFAPGVWADDGVVGFVRDSARLTSQTYYSGYLSDTLTISNLTISAGVRYDYQKAFNEAVTVPCCRWNTADYPEVPLTPISVEKSDTTVWKDFSPRLGITYAVGSSGKTLVKASYARFANQLGGGQASNNSNAPIGPSYLYYYWNDDGDTRVDPGEVDFDYGIIGASYIDPEHPNATTALVRNADNFKAPKTDEFILGAEHELVPAFVVGLQTTYRRMSDFTELAPLSADGSRVLNPSDYTCTVEGPYPQPGGSPQTITVCNPKPGVWSENRLQRNRPGYYQTYWDVGFSAQKRYADKWMARFNFTYINWKQHGLGEGQSDPSNLQGGTEADGAVVSVTPGTISGAKPGVFINARWYMNLSAMYTLPLDFNISTSLFAREGYLLPYYYRVTASGVPAYGSPKLYQIGNPDDQRLPAIVEWDLGLSKVVKVGPLDITLMVDCFNVLNRNTVLQRQLRVRGSTTTPNINDNIITEQQNPRIFRFGARLSF